MWIRTFSPESCEVWHSSETNPGGEEDLVSIEIRVYTKLRFKMRSSGIMKYDEPDKPSKRYGISNLPRSELLSNKSEHTWSVVQYFSGVFEDEPLRDDARQKIIEEVYRVAESDLPDDAPSRSVIHVDIWSREDNFLESAAVAFLEEALSSVGLEKVTVDSCFSGFQDSCAICMEYLIDKKDRKHFRQMEQPKRRSKRVLGLQSRSTTIAKRKREESPPSVVIARLPCTHQFHGQRIFNWLKKKHACPLCRHEVGGQPSLRTTAKPAATS